MIALKSGREIYTFIKEDNNNENKKESNKENNTQQPYRVINEAERR